MEKNPLLIFQIFFCWLFYHVSSSSDYEIEFIAGISPPPSIPTDCKQLKYSLPLDRQSSFPVKAYLKFKNGTVVKSGANSMAKFDIESLDATSKVTTGDTWLSTGGELCQWGVQGLFPLRMQRKYFTKRCLSSHKLTGFTTDRGLLTVDGLFHKHPTDTVPSGNRIYRVTVHLEDNSTIFAESNPFRVDAPAKEVVIVTQPPATVQAQEKFAVEIKVIDKDGATLTDGADSCLFGEIQVFWTKETSIFYHKESKTEILHSEKIRMRGDHVQMKEAMYTYVIRKQLENGTVTFEDIEILDVTPAVKLNVTTFMQSFPFSRRPDDYEDLNGIVREVLDDGEDIFYQNIYYPLSKAIKLTNDIQVTEQIAKTIVILDKENIKATQGANFLIADPIIVEVRDENDNRIYSGRDASLNIVITTTPESACLSVDSTMTTVEGRAEFKGSICTAIYAVKLHFAADSVIDSNALIGDETAYLKVTNEIHLATFTDNKFSGSDSNLGPSLAAFAQFCADNVNSGYHDILGDRKLLVHPYDTKNDISETIKQYKIMKDSSKDDPSKEIRGIIGFGSNTLSLKMQPWLTQDKMPQIATKEEQYEFGDKNLYPYYSRVNWEMGASSHSVMMAARDRGWKKIVVMRHMDYDVSKIFYTKAKEFGIEMSEVSIPTVPLEKFGEHGILRPELQKVKDANTKIIWVFCLAPQYWKLIREAILFGIAPIHGYQWVTMGLTAWHAPFVNQLSLCSEMEPLCTIGLTGMKGFDSTYYLAGLRTELWEPVLTQHIKKDRMNAKGTISKHTLIVVTGAFALGYDAMLVYAYGLDQLVKANKTITGESLALAVRNVTVHGLTGHISLDEKGNRPGYRGFMVVVDPHPPELGAPVAGVAILPRYFEIESDTATSQLELKAQLQWPLFTYENVTPPYPPYNPVAMPNTTYMNKRIYNGSDGMLDFYEDLVPIPPNTEPPKTWLLLEEDTVAPFYCEAGCGGNRTNRFDITEYENGDCVDMNECRCHDGYVGDTCDEMICICSNGYCEVPRTCICQSGWSGEKCEQAICKSECVNGACTSPDVCTCDSGYTGSTCKSHYGVVVGVPVVLLTLLIVFGVFFARWFLKKQALKAALANLDWKVNWDEEVQTGVGAISMVSTAAEDVVHSKQNYVTWKSVRCYAQKYPCQTLDVNDVGLRLEIVQLKEIRHNNLIHFVGACLDHPNVSILTEPCPKGSLEDLLANDTVRLGWDFKYSLLKDICRGMDFLHRSEIGSHGRLKSTNCLVDNRWTCKIAGFGVPTIRYKAPRKTDPAKEEEMNSAERGLFWTAPEHLVSAKSIDDVGSGSQAGDCFSFAIIMCEVISREEPYVNELSFLKPEDVLALVKNKDAPEAAKAKRRWYESGGDTMKNFRPKIDNSYFPEDYAAKTGLKKLLDVNWNDKAENRLSFRQNLDKLNEIHPIKGELIDNLVNMLEKYSSNLEAIVADRTKELIAEKAKTEMLISQMFPKSVAEDLKHGRAVEAESFECVTIFFSDLVGFTAIAKQSSPLQVVTLLNDLYTTFDAILDNYDVYKVETIGDAYMVVSGLPIRNGDLHAGEIATMSLDLLSSMCDFKIRHMPGEVLQLRIGMHSGPCVAGVVGLKMPRYCLFGDTVNTASRMESSSMALRIHMSEHTANILFRLGGYHLDCRGEREVKGKGVMTTYWLEGKDGFTKPLPSKEMAASASKHEFK